MSGAPLPLRLACCVLTSAVGALFLAGPLGSEPSEPSEPTRPVAAQQPAATFQAHALADVLSLDARLFGSRLAAIDVGHGEVRVDPGLTPSVRSTAANAEMALGTAELRPDEQVAEAPPATDPRPRTLAPLDLSPIASVTGVLVDTSARPPELDGCPSSLSIGTSRTRLASARVLGGSLVGSAVLLDASRTSSGVALERQPSGSAAVVASSEVDVGGISLLDGLVTVRVSDTVRLSASSDGAETTTRVSDYDVIVELRDGTRLRLPRSGAAVTVPVDLGMARVSLSVRAPKARTSVEGAAVQATLAAVVAVDLRIDFGLLTLVDVEFGVGRIEATATAPPGGVECPPTEEDSDGDGITDDEEAGWGTDPHDPDTDNDGLTDGAETRTHETDPLDLDTDDGCDPDGLEVDNGTDPHDPSDDSSCADHDGDGLSDDQEAGLGTDPLDPDTDNDGLTDGAEVHIHETDPLDPDTDNGCTPDGVEIDNGTSPHDPTDDGACNDPDQDGLLNHQEEQHGTDPLDPDTDNDELTDGDEVHTHETDPLDPDTDDGCVPDGQEVAHETDPHDPTDDGGCQQDPDGDGLTNDQEAELGTDPLDPDTDNDSLDDGDEAHTYETDPLDPDTDDGCASDGLEVDHATDPHDPSDDGVCDDGDGTG